jgi:hypothetical protein
MDDCTHEELFNDNGLELCVICGLELADNYTFCGKSGVVLKPQSARTLTDSTVDYGRCLRFLDASDLAVKHEVIRLFDAIVGARKNIHQTQKNGIMAACAYHLCVEMNKVRTIEEIVEAFGITLKTFGNGCRVVYEHCPRFRDIDPSPSEYLASVLRNMTTEPDAARLDGLRAFMARCEAAMPVLFGTNDVSPSRFCFACVHLYYTLGGGPEPGYSKSLNKKKISAVVDGLRRHLVT